MAEFAKIKDARMRMDFMMFGFSVSEVSVFNFIQRFFALWLWELFGRQDGLFW